MVGVKISFSGINLETGKKLSHTETHFFPKNPQRANELALKKMEKSFPEKIWGEIKFQIISKTIFYEPS